MLDMEMGTGKTRVAIDVAFARYDVYDILVVCPKAVVPVWRENLEKFAYTGTQWACWDQQKGTIKAKAEDLKKWRSEVKPGTKRFVVMNYDSVWRAPMGDFITRCNFDMVILDESHRAKAAGSKVSKFLAILGRTTRYKMCLSGTPMANSPLDVYGQYRFLDRTIFGTNHYQFLQEYAIMGGPERRFVVGFRNQQTLNRKFKSIAYTCKMADVADRIKLPDALPPTSQKVQLPAKDMKTCRELADDFIAECGNGNVVVKNVLGKMMRLQQIASGYCVVQNSPIDYPEVTELNTAKEDALADMLEDISPEAPVVVFCVFRHDLEAIARAATKAKREAFEISGSANRLTDWRESKGGVLAVQIQAGAEGIDMTISNHAIYYSIPHSLALYNQSKARLYRPGQKNAVSFCHLLAEGTIDEAMYRALTRKEDVIESIKNGTFDYGYMKR
jgi:SNF2 family DNA or RNA helicase